MAKTKVRTRYSIEMRTEDGSDEFLLEDITTLKAAQKRARAMKKDWEEGGEIVGANVLQIEENITYHGIGD